MADWIPLPLSRCRVDSLQWLWPGYLPLGKLAILDGDPELGKSLITLDLAARLSRGEAMPDGTIACDAHPTILLCAEDNLVDTVRPRAEAAGADLDRIIAPSYHPRFPEDAKDLALFIQDQKAKLVVIDPLVSFLGKKISVNDDQSVRRALQPLTKVAEYLQCTILFVRHLTKKAAGKPVAHRGIGSMGIAATMRTALFVSPHPGGEWNTLSVSKSNVARSRTPLKYRIASTPGGVPRIEWLGPEEGYAPAIVDTTFIREKERAVEWLQQFLSSGPKPKPEIIRTAAEAEISERTLKRAGRALRLRTFSNSNPDGEGVITFWELTARAESRETPAGSVGHEN